MMITKNGLILSSKMKPGVISLALAGIAFAAVDPSFNVYAASKPISLAKSATVKSAVTSKFGRNPFAPAYNVAELYAPPAPVNIVIPIFANALPPSSSIEHGHSLQTITGPSSAPPNIGKISGIIRSSGIHAIYEYNGQATIIQAGDQLPDGIGRVVSIDDSSVTIKVTATGQLYTMPISAGTMGSDNTNNGNSPVSTGANPPPMTPPDSGTPSDNGGDTSNQDQ